MLGESLVAVAVMAVTALVQSPDVGLVEPLPAVNTQAVEATTVHDEMDFPMVLDVTRAARNHVMAFAFAAAAAADAFAAAAAADAFAAAAAADAFAFALAAAAFAYAFAAAAFAAALAACAACAVCAAALCANLKAVGSVDLTVQGVVGNGYAFGADAAAGDGAEARWLHDASPANAGYRDLYVVAADAEPHPKVAKTVLCPHAVQGLMAWEKAEEFLLVRS